MILKTIIIMVIVGNIFTGILDFVFGTLMDIGFTLRIVQGIVRNILLMAWGAFTLFVAFFPRLR